MKNFFCGLVLLLCFIALAQAQNVTKKHIPVYGMMQLTTVNNDGTLNNIGKIRYQLETMKKINAAGIMIDVWWGIVENSPKQYNWRPYLQLAQMCKDIGIKMQVVLSFHQCGGNTGDTCSIPIPQFVRDSGNDGFYKDKNGYVNKEYISLGADDEPIFGGRTAIQLYSDFMISFKSAFQSFLGSTIPSIEVGLGPAGELRYPSYPEALGRWRFPGIGEFQCYDKFMLKSLKEAAIKAGKLEWGNGGPSNAGSYNDFPHNVAFFSNGNDNWNSEYGKFFLNWYSSVLIEHGRKILKIANDLFSPVNTETGAKIAGIHWWYSTDSHAAELTAGYYHTRNHNGYKDISKMLKSVNSEFLFTCLEMYDSDMHNCGCSPERLVSYTRSAAWSEGVHYSGENALPTGGDRGYDKIVQQAKVGKGLHGFTYLRLFDWVFEPENLRRLENFVRRMN